VTDKQSFLSVRQKTNVIYYIVVKFQIQMDNVVSCISCYDLSLAQKSCDQHLVLTLKVHSSLNVEGIF
jgi:hypothetical protein